MTLVDRVKAILITPSAEWPRIATEPATVQSIYTGYVMILALIGPVMLLLSALLFVPLGIAYGLRAAVSLYVMALIMVAVIALIADLLAPSFGGTKDYVRSLKLIAYSYTAVWVAQVALIVPILGGLAALVGGIYAFYLFFLGAPVLGRCSTDKAVPYTIVIVFGTVVLMVLVQQVMLRMLLMAPMVAGPASLIR